VGVVVSNSKNSSECCGRGGARPGCGRKPGVKTRPVRLPEWLLVELEKLGDPRELIKQACKEKFQLHCDHKSEAQND